MCLVEREAYAAAALMARMEDQAMAPAPVWDDITTFDGRPWRGVVDLVVAGIPCQPYSVAGKRRGNEDERALWPHAARIVGECRPAMVFLENVPGFIRFFRPLGEELCRLGYEVEAPLFLAAGDVGATHKRERVYILAHAKGKRFPEPGRAREWRNGPENVRCEMGNSDEEMADSRQSRLAGRKLLDRGLREEQPPPERGRLPLHPPGRNGDWSAIPLHLWPVESEFLRVPHGTPNRMERCGAIGDGVVPLAVALAFRILTHRAGIEIDEGGTLK